VVTLRLGPLIVGCYNGTTIRVIDIINSASPVLVKSISIKGATQYQATAAISGDGKSLFYFVPKGSNSLGDLHGVDLALDSDNVVLSNVSITPRNAGGTTPSGGIS